MDLSYAPFHNSRFGIPEPKHKSQELARMVIAIGNHRTRDKAIS